MKKAIFWFRRDLRVSDNTGLAAAVRAAETVYPVFIFEDAFRTGVDVGAARLQFLIDSLHELKESLAELGYPLVVRFGRSETVIPQLARELNAEAVFCNKRYEPYAQARDGRVFTELNRSGIHFTSFKDAVVWEEQEILTKADRPYTVFTPYSKAWIARGFPKPVPPIPKRRKVELNVVSEPLPITSAELGHPCTQTIPAAGEREAQRRCRDFIANSLGAYHTQRDIAAVDGTSQLSPHLRCGTMGIRTLLNAVRDEAINLEPSGKAGAVTYQKELVWREFYLQILHNFHHVMKGNFRPEYDGLGWSGSEEHFSAWCSGMTGYPIIDAAMRCLARTGWMHNRLRMAVAMFLTKDLLIHWQRGERYFMHQLVDGDMAANNGGWQWSAGTGTDAAPYFRIFNPVSQGHKCDPEGVFVRRWVPELGKVPPKFIHEPWLWPGGATGYPARIVLHEEQRPIALAMYAKVVKRAIQMPV